MNLWSIVAGLIVAAECFLHLYGILLSVNYLGERDREGDITYFQFVMLLLCTVGFAVMTKNINFKLLSDVIGIASFTLFSVLGFVTLVFLGLNMYRKANKNNAKGSVLVAVLVAIYVVLSVFRPNRENIGHSEEPEYPDPEDFLSEYVTDDYHDGFIDGFGDGYSAAFKELTGDYP